MIGVVSEADMLAKEALAEPGVVAGLLHHKDVRKAEGLTAGDLMTHPGGDRQRPRTRSSRPPG